MKLRDVACAVRRADIASLPIGEACRALAELPEAKQYNVSPALLWRAARYALPPEQADVLLQRAGVRGRFKLADLAYLAQYDRVLQQVISAVVQFMEDNR